jgi:class 3 adenylate cyclase
MADDLHLNPLTGHGEFDSLIGAFSELRDAGELELARQRIWERFGVEGAVFISDMASFSSTSRKIGVCHFLKLIHRARQIIAPLIAKNNGLLLKCDADNCYAFFENTDDAIRASFDINAELFRHNDEFSLTEQIYLSVGIDYGRVLLIGDVEFFGDPVNTASKLGEDLAIKAETLVTKRALEHATLSIPGTAERMVARISDIEIKYVRLPMTEIERAELE